MHPDWARFIRDQCQAAGMPFFFKQWGEYLPLRTCRVCGCTDDDGCCEGCWWAAPGLCSSCEGLPLVGQPKQRYLRLGRKAAGAVLDGREWREMPVVTP